MTWSNVRNMAFMVSLPFNWFASMPVRVSSYRVLDEPIYSAAPLLTASPVNKFVFKIANATSRPTWSDVGDCYLRCPQSRANAPPRSANISWPLVLRVNHPDRSYQRSARAGLLDSSRRRTPRPSDSTARNSDGEPGGSVGSAAATFRPGSLTFANTIRGQIRPIAQCRSTRRRGDPAERRGNMATGPKRTAQ